MNLKRRVEELEEKTGGDEIERSLLIITLPDWERDFENNLKGLEGALKEKMRAPGKKFEKSSAPRRIIVRCSSVDRSDGKDHEEELERERALCDEAERQWEIKIKQELIRRGYKAEDIEELLSR